MYAIKLIKCIKFEGSETVESGSNMQNIHIFSTKYRRFLNRPFDFLLSGKTDMAGKNTSHKSSDVANSCLCRTIKNVVYSY